MKEPKLTPTEQAEIVRDAMRDPEKFHQGEEAERRFLVGMKCAFRQPLTAEEDALRKEIIAGWGGDPEAAVDNEGRRQKRQREKREAQRRAQKTKYRGKNE